MATALIETERISDWQSFHQIFQEVLGFPAFYGRNMDAWIDCLSGLEDGTSMTRFALQQNEMLYITISDTTDFIKRLPDIFREMVECAASVNSRSRANPWLALVFVEQSAQQDSMVSC